MKINQHYQEPVMIKDTVLNIDKVLPLADNKLSVYYFKFENGKSIFKNQIVSHKGSLKLILLDNTRKELLTIDSPYYYDSGKN